MRSIILLGSMFFLTATLFAVGREIEWLRLDYEKVHQLPDESKSAKEPT